MKCTKCNYDNPDAAKFCVECASPMEFHCPNCGSITPATGKFCMECAYNLRANRESATIDFDRPQSYTPKHLADKILTTRSAIEGERKLVTVLFADVANYTAMSEKLDPEEVHQIMDGCFKILMDEIHKYEGTINQFTGDGVMALFGAPVAHEDHAQRACYASLSIQRAIKEYGEKIKKHTGVDFAMRIGINSGSVIVGAIGDDLRMDYTAVGDTTNLAARIQQAAKPGQVWLSKKTHTIVQSYFHYELAEEASLKGKTQRQHIYHILYERAGVRTRFQAGTLRGITDLVGRRPEMESLMGVFNRAKKGEGQIVDVVGEAGVGKSRLVYEFKKKFEQVGIFLTGISVQYGQNINFLPVVDILKEAFLIEEGMTEDRIGQRIEEVVADDLFELIPFYRYLLSLKVTDAKFNALDPDARKFGIFEAVKSLLLSISKKKPLVIFLEDVHWMDKISEALFSYFAHCIIDQRVFMLSAYRPGASPTWAQGAHYQRLGIETLSSKSSIRLVRNMLKVPALEKELEERIVKKTEGNPLFVEEIVRELLERGDIVKSGEQYICTRPIDQCEVPNTIQGVLAARMDRLSEDLKKTMQVASVIGRDFLFRLLKSIMEIGDELRSQMNNLVGLEILYEKTLYPELEYIFKHALTQEVAYESLLKQRRREIHERVARNIEELYADRIEEHYESLAHHYEHSGNAAKAVDYLILAGKKSNKIGAVKTAIDFLEKALQISKDLSPFLENVKQVQLLFELASAQVAIGALGAGVDHLKSAINLSRKHCLVNFEMKSLWKLGFVMIWWPDLEEAEQTIEDGILRARKLKNKGLECRIQIIKAVRASSYYQRNKLPDMIIEIEKLALASNEPATINIFYHWKSIFERWLGNPRKASELFESSFNLEWVLNQYDIIAFSGLSFLQGIALAEIGRIEDGIAMLRNAIEICEKFGAHVMLGQLYNSLGYCYGEILQTEQAWDYNLKSEDIGRKLYLEFPMGRSQSGHALMQAQVNLVENLFDQGDIDTAWEKIKSIEHDAKSNDFFYNRYQWESRLNYLSAQILLKRNDINQVESIIDDNLKMVRKERMLKREGSFLCLLGKVQSERNVNDMAINTINQAIQILKNVENPRQLWQSHCSLASVFEKTGKFSEAQDQWGIASAIIQNTAEELSDHKLRKSFLNAQHIKEILSKTGI